jgi:DNA-directed RNA polymerase specialized sigma24 family protein
MEIYPNQEQPFRSEQLREHVDRLPMLQRELVSGVFFGQIPLAHVAARLGRSVPHCRKELTDALETLKTKVLEDNEVGSLPADDPT